MWCPSYFFATAHPVEDDISRGLPNERLGLVIPVGEPGIDGTFEFFNAAEGAATDHAFRDQGEEALHLIEPRTTNRQKNSWVSSGSGSLPSE